MRHNCKLKRLNRDSAHIQSMLKNMAISLIRHERIKTTLTKAKVLRSYVEKIITKARTNTLANHRYLISALSDREIVKKLLEEVGPRFAKRPGGYTRIYKFGFRVGDMAPVGVIELVDRVEQSAKPSDKASKAKTIDAKAVEAKDKKVAEKAPKASSKPVAEPKAKAPKADKAVKAIAAKSAPKTGSAAATRRSGARGK